MGAFDTRLDPQSMPILDGVYLENVSLSTGTTNVIAHTLGRRFRGILLCLNSSNANIWHDQSENNYPTKHVHIQTDANTTASFWIF